MSNETFKKEATRLSQSDERSTEDVKHPIIFWHNIISPHQAAITKALAVKNEVVVVASEELTAARRTMGWRRPNLGNARIVVSPNHRETNALIDACTAQAVHIIAGARWTPLGRWARQRCDKRRARVGIMSEAADHTGWKGVARWIKYSYEQARWAHNYDFVLAIGEIGVRWFHHCGYPASKIFPFGYFVDHGPDFSKDDQSVHYCGVPELVFIGRCAEGKGLETLVLALKRCETLSWKLRIVGGGPLEHRLRTLVQRLNLTGRITFSPFLPHAAAMKILSSADMLILPSDGKEGWGAVVNEALVQGVPAIVSDRCGAADLLQESWRGGVFAAGCVMDLSAVLQKWIQRGKRSPELTERIRAWSNCVSGEVASLYLQAIICHIYEGADRPLVPWGSHYE